jgi:hypothetical protein
VILLIAALVHFAFPVVPVEATIPLPISIAVTIDERRINQTRHGVSARSQTKALAHMVKAHRSG